MSKTRPAIWRMPVLLAVMTVAALLGALLTDAAIIRIPAWLILAFPLLLCLRFALIAKPQR